MFGNRYTQLLTKATAVEMLKVEAPSPPVPQVSLREWGVEPRVERTEPAKLAPCRLIRLLMPLA